MKATRSKNRIRSRPANFTSSTTSTIHSTSIRTINLQLPREYQLFLFPIFPRLFLFLFVVITFNSSDISCKIRAQPVRERNFSTMLHCTLLIKSREAGSALSLRTNGRKGHMFRRTVYMDPWLLIKLDGASP